MKITCPYCKRRLRLRRGESIPCKCGKHLNYMQFFRNKITYVVYLVDANIFIYAENVKDRRSKSCQQVLKFSSEKIKIGTTDVIIKEISACKTIVFPETVQLYSTGKISDELAVLRTNYLKQPSPADLSLVQAAIDHPEIKGIITYDKDFDRIATQGVIQKKSSSKFWLGTAQAFLQKYEIKTHVKPKL